MNTANIDQRILGHFEKLVSSTRMGHAYLFVGPKEAGKTQTALAVAQMVNCESLDVKPCGECPSCKKVVSGNHPDVTIVQGLEGSIKIDQVRTLLGRLQLKAFEARTKVFIIRNVETMTMEAANSLLKTLEEPAANTLLILTTSNLEDNLDTIRSRCHVVRFFPSSRSQIQKVLGENAAMDQLLTVYTDGCLGQARHLLDDDFIERKNEILDSFLNKSNEEYFKKLSTEKEEAREALQVFLSVVRDAILLKTGVPADELMHTDRLKNIRSLSAHSFEELAALYEQIVRTRELVEENLNVKMAFSLLRQRIWDN